MPDPRTIDLIHLHLDGVLGPEEEAELRQRIDADPGARQLFDDLKFVSEQLSGTRAAEPPADFKTRVMSAVRGARPHATVSGFDRGVGRQRARVRVVRIALGIAAVIAIAFIMVPSLRKSVDGRHVSGTMTAPVSGPTITSELPVTGTGISGTIRTTADAGRLTLSIALDSRGDRQVLIAFDPNVLSIESFTGADTLPADPGRPGVRSFNVPDGVAELRFIRRTPSETSIALKIREGEHQVFTTEISVGQSTNF